MLKLTFDRAKLTVSVTQGSIKASGRERLQLSLLDDNVSSTIPDTDAIMLQCKPKGQTDGDCVLLEAVLQTAQYNSAAKLYDVELPADTDRILALLGVGNGDGTDDAKNPVEVDGVLLLFTYGYEKPIESDTFPVKLVRPQYLSSDTTPLALPGPLDWLVAHATRYLPAVTGLTGGGSTNLDGFPTVGLSVPVLVETVINDEYARWLVRDGEEAADDVGIIHPVDHNDSTNPKVIIRLN